MSDNTNLNATHISTTDEFYTLYPYIQEELSHYSPSLFTHKTIFCPCDTPSSNFFKYFVDNSRTLQLSRMICTHISSPTLTIYHPYTNKTTTHTLPNNTTGDFNNPHLLPIFQDPDTIIVTNPSFSNIRDLIHLLTTNNKQFLIIASINHTTYASVFPLIKSNQIHLGVTHGSMVFNVPDSYDRSNAFYNPDTNQKQAKLGNICWLTNLPHDHTNDFLPLTIPYTPSLHPCYDEYDAININRLKDIPYNYNNLMGVPITYLQYHNPNQFTIIDQDRLLPDSPTPGKRFHVNGKETYARIIIKKNPIQTSSK